MTEQEKEHATLDLCKTLAAEGDTGEVLHAVDKRVGRVEAQVEELKKENANWRTRCWICLAVIGGLLVVIGLLIWSAIRPKSAPATVAPTPAPESKKIGFQAHTPNSNP